ncbi:MAG: TonB-dependent receptor [Gemmatimonadales bacterium]|nr:TonB-dependent receptor [Gemmatimonadales bacterium]
MSRALLLGLTLAVATPAAAQVDSAAPPPVRDTVTRDTVAVLLPPFALPIQDGPLPHGIRFTFTADSLLFTNARTLSDLLGHIPGVYVVRGGWYGQAEIVLFGGKGAAAVVVYWDGVPYLPLGRDSVYLDLARIPLAPLERVEVIVLPAELQIYLVTARPRSTAPLTQVGILTGDQDIASYRAGYATRGRSGLGVALMADWNHLDGNPNTTTTGFDSNDLWLKAEYVPPGGRVGASLQIAASSWHRRASSDSRVDGWRQQRRDRLLRVFLAAREDGLGFRFVGSLGTSAVERDTLVPNRAISTANVELSHRWRRAAVGVRARFGAAGAPSQLEVNGSWQLWSRITVAAAARQSRYANDISGERAWASAGVRLPLGFSVRTDIAWQRDLQAPLAVAIPRRTAMERAGWVQFDHPRLSVAVGRGRRDAFTPFDFAAGIKPVDRLSTTPLSEFVAARASIRPVAGLTVSGWYFDAVVGGGDFEPPHHARLSATFYSKFWRVFRSGVFALRGEVAVESWSRWGLGGVGATGTVLPMGGATFVEANVELQLVGVTLFWVIRNANGMRAAYVEGLGHPKSVQLYGARWSFTN